MANAEQAEISESTKRHPAWIRLEDQLSWYDSKSVHCQRWYKGLKLLQVVLGVSIPLLAYQNATFLTALTGVAIAVLEAVQHLNQYSTLWIEYRSTAERLKHARWLFLSRAGEFRELREEEALRLLAEQVETYVSTEHASWTQQASAAVQQTKGERG
jgi:hypothetical protein